MSDAFANYDLYADPYIKRLWNEISKVKSKKEGPFYPSDFAHFDSLHYCGHNHIEGYLETQNIGPNSKLLEFCPGNGSTSRFVADRFKCNLTTIDIYTSFNAIHSEINSLCKIDNIKIVQGDATNINLSDLGLENQCDIVYSIQSFYYIANKPALFANCNKALKLGGNLYIEDHVVENNIPLLEKEEEIASKFQFISRLQRNDYVNLLEAAGFHVDEYVHRTTEWSRYLFERAERFLREKDQLVSEYGQELWDTRYASGIHVSCRLYHQLGMTLEEAKANYPLTCAEFGEEEFEKWVCEIPAKFGGAYIKATKVNAI